MKTLIGPRQTILVTVRGMADIYGTRKIIDNVLSVDWHMPCSFDHFFYAISIKKTHLTYQLILQSKIFVVNFIPDNMEDAVLFCGTHSGLHIDKFKEAKLFKLDSGVVDCCKIAGALGYLECEVAYEHDCGDHAVFFGKVIHKEVKQDSKRLFHKYDNLFTTTND